ncbi:hypothetical protein GUF79_00220, partial [Xanthomonas citri pv. citri]|nr:hypothetical protein [Xanthomonas citri pv. citri]
LITLRFNHYNILINPTHFINIITNPNIQLTITNPNNHLITQQNLLNQSLLQHLLHNPHNNINNHTLYTTTQNQK